MEDAWKSDARHPKPETHDTQLPEIRGRVPVHTPSRCQGHEDVDVEDIWQQKSQGLLFQAGGGFGCF